MDGNGWRMDGNRRRMTENICHGILHDIFTEIILTLFSEYQLFLHMQVFAVFMKGEIMNNGQVTIYKL